MEGMYWQLNVTTFFLFQAEKEHGVEDPYYCLSDFVAPLDTGVHDYIGCFAVSIMGAEEMAKKYVFVSPCY